MASWLWSTPPPPLQAGYQNCGYNRHLHTSHHHIIKNQNNTPLCSSSRIYCNISSSSNDANSNNKSERSALQLYSEIERVLTETVIQSQAGSGGSGNWTEVEGAWVLQPRDSTPRAIVHFVGGIFVGAAPQLTYRLFLERLSEKGIFVIATPYASGFDHFYIADEVQFKFDRCLRFLQDKVQDLPIFGIGHSLGSLVHLLIGSRYAVRRNGNVLMAFNNKEASMAIPLFSPVLVPMAQNIGPFLSQIASSPTIRLGAEMTLKQLQILSPPFVKQALPLFEQLPSLYMDLVNGREHFTPKPEETQRLVLGSDSAISSMLDLSIRLTPGDHGLPLQQAFPDVPPAMTDAVNRGGEILANLTAGTPWEPATREVANTLGAESTILGGGTSKDMDMLVDVITSWIDFNMSRNI